MPADIFLSYARVASAPHAGKLADALGAAHTPAFLDEREVAYGERFPERLIEALFAARVVVVFAEPVYFTRWYCRLEYEAALAPFRRLLAAGAPEAERRAALGHLVVALAPGGAAEGDLDAIPPAVRSIHAARADDVQALVALVAQRLAAQTCTLGERLGSALDRSEVEALFTRKAELPPPLRLAPLPGKPRFPVVVPLGLRGTLRDRFVGREDDLWQIHELLAPESQKVGRAALTSTLRGVGGVGKTQLAAEYLYRYGPRHYSGGLFWLDAQRDVVQQHHAILSKLETTTPKLAELRAEVGDERLPEHLRGLLADAFRSVPVERPALLIVDDVPEPPAGTAPQPLEMWYPAADAVACLVTSRAAVQFGGRSQLTPLTLDVLAPEPAVDVLTGGQVERDELTEDEWRRIAAWVGHLPLALTLLNSALSDEYEPLSAADVLAAAHAGRSPTAELDRAADALRSSVPAAALRGVTEAFDLSYERLPPDAQAAACLLAECAPAPIPAALLDALGGPCREPKVRSLLRSRSFVLPPQRESGGRHQVPYFGTMHGVLADFLRTRRGAARPVGEAAGAVAAALLALMTPERCVDPTAWPLIRACVPHAEYLIAAEATAERLDAPTVVALADRVGRYWRSAGSASRARISDEVAATVVERRLPADDPDALRALHNLAETLERLREYPRSIALHEKVFTARTRVLGPEHRETLESAVNLAAARWNAGERSRQQADLLARLYEVQKRVLGAEHPETLGNGANLAATLHQLGDLADARARKEEVYAARQRVLGPEHLDTLWSGLELAITLHALDDYVGARALIEHVYSARQRLLGPEHPDTLHSGHELAVTLHALKDHAGARASIEQVYAARQRVLGAEHPDTLQSGHNLAVTLHELGDYAGARTLIEEVYAARQRALGAEHQDTLLSGHELAVALHALKDYAGARALNETLYAVCQRVFGPDHLDTLRTASELAVTLFRQGELAPAAALLETVYRGRLAALGPEHAETERSRSDLEYVAETARNAAAAKAAEPDAGGVE